jgi:hypothetical protein
MQKHKIRVVKTAADGARLYVDDELLDTTNDLYASEGEPTLVGVFGKDHMFRAEVFVRPSEHAEAEIRVNGEWIAGDKVVRLGASLFCFFARFYHFCWDAPAVVISEPHPFAICG